METKEAFMESIMRRKIPNSEKQITHMNVGIYVDETRIRPNV